MEAGEIIGFEVEKASKFEDLETLKLAAISTEHVKLGLRKKHICIILWGARFRFTIIKVHMAQTDAQIRIFCIDKRFNTILS